MNKAHLCRLIDGLPESRVPQVQAYLETLHASGMKALLAQASEEDEEIPPEEEAAVREAKADIAANGTISHQEARKMLGLGITVKEKVHSLLKILPQETTYDEIIDSITKLKRQDDLDLRTSMEAYLDAAPDDDEEFTDIEREAVRIGLEQIRCGEFATQEEVLRELELG